jgi:hypothetical protein
MMGLNKKIYIKNKKTKKKVTVQNHSNSKGDEQ